MSDFEAIGKAFIDFYYKKFDSGARDEVAALYEPVNGMMNFNHSTFAKGAQGIAEKLRSLTFQTIAHTISTLDIQPTYDNCILIVVTGALKADNDPPMSFTETFLLRFHNNSWLVVNNVFRLILQDLNQNSIIALLKGPDTRYKNILMKDGEQLIVPIVNDQCQDKNSFLQINIRELKSFSHRVH
ncbi:unnamed protein product [Rotaria sordida]|uniref:NTF2 domain-containing protein n=1 Tax=Rotaria sordida TaxID=392033 RepID=A0A813SFF4_9BILA|nr:unnamed protein product [Rotaria sordida]CAF0795545.1 unnamed protein product [Rotaria sordida]CAF1225556.1 unnamed protein product [Rotaria sordida]CAF3514637.1 unnamed protein product [Rotaria sordida]CAF3660571.1 unnamed protein product [Rotaria sordida]